MNGEHGAQGRRSPGWPLSACYFWVVDSQRSSLTSRRTLPTPSVSHGWLAGLRPELAERSRSRSTPARPWSAARDDHRPHPLEVQSALSEITMAALLDAVPRWTGGYHQEGWAAPSIPIFELTMAFTIVLYLWESYLDMRQHARVKATGDAVPADLKTLVAKVDKVGGAGGASRMHAAGSSLAAPTPPLPPATTRASRTPDANINPTTTTSTTTTTTATATHRRRRRHTATANPPSPPLATPRYSRSLTTTDRHRLHRTGHARSQEERARARAHPARRRRREEGGRRRGGEEGADRGRQDARDPGDKGGWLVGWSVGWLVGWLVGMLIGWLVARADPFPEPVALLHPTPVSQPHPIKPHSTPRRPSRRCTVSTSSVSA